MPGGNYYAEKGAASQEAYDAYYATTGNTTAYTAQAMNTISNQANRGEPEQFKSTQEALREAGVVDHYGIYKDDKMIYLIILGIACYFWMC